MNPSILLVDDDAAIARIVTLTLEEAGYAVRRVKGADAAAAALKKERFAMILLDVELPGMSGFDFLDLLKKQAETATIPVIMLTVRGEEDSRVKGLKTGADDYLVKPFSPKELAARVEALLRRVRHAGAVAKQLRIGDILIDVERRDVSVKGKSVELRPMEFDLLVALARSEGKILSYSQLSQTLSPARPMTPGNLHTHANSLRAKLGPAGDFFTNVHGAGYKLAA